MDISTITDAFSDVLLLQPSTGVFVAAILAAILLGMSAFASGSEIAFFSLSPADVAELEDEKTDCDKKIQMLREDSERTLATILITNNFVNVTIIMLLNYVFAGIVEFGPKAYWLQFLIITVILTFLLLLFGEIMPKVYARQDPLKFCRRCVGGIMFARKVFWALEDVLLKSGIVAEKIIQKENHVLSVDDLEQALELTDKEDIKDEQSMLKGIIRFGDETAKEVMTTRQNIVDLDIRSTYPEVLKCIVENNYSRIPVYQDNTDNIRGVLYIKDLLPHLSKASNFRWQSLMRPPYFVPETKKIDDLMREFQENKIHIAIVVDEFGGTSGLQQVFDVQYATDVVAILLIYRNAAVVVLDNTVQYFCIVRLYVQSHDVLTACHHLLGCFVAKSYDTLKHALFVLDIVLVGQFKGMFQIVNAQYVFLLLHHFLGNNATTQQNVLDRPEHLSA